MSIIELETRIRALRNESIVAAVSGDMPEAQRLHNFAAELQALLSEALHRDVELSQK
jgi:hypothetical protein